MSASNKLYLLTNGRTVTLDMYEGAVVSAASSIDARRMHPDGSNSWELATWCKNKDVQVTFLGFTTAETGVVLASFLAA